MTNSHCRAHTLWIKFHTFLNRSVSSSRIHRLMTDVWVILSAWTGSDWKSSACWYTNESRLIWRIRRLLTEWVWSLFWCHKAKMLILRLCFQRARGRMGKSRMSKHDTKKLLRNKHSGLIELLGLYSSPWLYDSKHERQTRILITGGAGCVIFQSSPKQCVFTVYYKAESTDDAFDVSLHRNMSSVWDSIVFKFWPVFRTF